MDQAKSGETRKLLTLQRFAGFGKYKTFYAHPGWIITKEFLSEMGFDERQQRNLQETSIIKTYEGEQAIEYDIESLKLHPLTVEERLKESTNDIENRQKPKQESKENMEKVEKEIDRQIKNAWEKSTTPLINANNFLKLQPCFYDKAKLWWVWNDKCHCWKEIDEIDLLNCFLDSTEELHITNSKFKNELITALQMLARRNIPKPAKTKYIQFKDKAVNIEDGKIYPVSSRFFFTNPIPWEIGETPDTPTLDKLFKDWVGERYVQTLYEIIAYCCYRGYPIQVLFSFIGCGRNGKTQFQRILTKFLGISNVSCTELDSLAGPNKNRFETFKLYKKLACQMGETNFGLMNNTSILKKITGGDMIGFEKKGKDPFDDYSYAKILINSNSLPTSEDTSEGFYRRWVIIDFPNQFKEGTDIFLTIPDQEYNNLCVKVMQILPGLLQRGSFTNQGTIEERKKKYIESSNPLGIFIDACCVRDSGRFIRYGELYKEYAIFLNKNKRRIVNHREFKDLLLLEGFENRKTWKEGESGYFVEGLCLKDETNVTNVTAFHIHSSHTKNELENKSHLSQYTNGYMFETEKIDGFNRINSTFLPCSICGAVHSGGWTLESKRSGKIYCDICAESEELNSVKKH